MRTKRELWKTYFAKLIDGQFGDILLEAYQAIDFVAVKILYEVQNIIQNEKYSVFEAIEAIVCVFEKYGIDFGGRHDF